MSNSNIISLKILSTLFVFSTVFLLLETSYNQLIFQFLDPKSEYTIGEQLTKFYLLQISLLSLITYNYYNEPKKIKLSIIFFLLSLVMYLSESNMITENMQPVFGAILVSALMYYLFQDKKWISLGFIVTGFGFVSFGSVQDIIHDGHYIPSNLNEVLLNTMNIISEETADFLGVNFIFLACFLCFSEIVNSLLKLDKKILFFGVISSLILTFGNGFLHYQYPIYSTHLIMAILMSVIGFIGLIIFSKQINHSQHKLTLFTPQYFYLFLFLLFIVMPSSHGTAKMQVSYLIWLPAMLALAINMWNDKKESPIISSSGRNT